MKTRRLGFSDLNLSGIGVGTWAMGGVGYECGLGRQDDQESIRTIREAVERGINWIDTAPMYGLGHAEEVVGNAVRDIRDKVVIATKCGILWDENKRFRFCLREESIRSELEASLRRLQVDCIDLYQLHLPTPEKEVEEGWSCIAKLIQEGKVRYGGISNFTLEQIQKVQQIHPLASIQPVYNMFNRDIEKGVMDYCTRNRIGIISYSPLCSGLINDSISRERIKSLEPDDFRPRLPDFQEPLLGVHLRALNRLRPIAEEAGLTLSQMAIAWVRRRREPTSAIVGARCVGHIDEIVEAERFLFSDDLLQEIEVVLSEHTAEKREAQSPGIIRMISRLKKLFNPKLTAVDGVFKERKMAQA